MVFQPPGLRVGSTGRDPSAIYQPPSVYVKHMSFNAGAHGQSFTIRPADCRRNVRLTIQNASVKNFDVNFGVTADVMFDAEFNGAPVHTLIDVYLHWFLVNTQPVGGRTVTPMAPFAFFNRHEVMANGSFTDDTIYPEQLYLDYWNWLSGDLERSARARTMGMETKDRPQNDTNTKTVETMYDEAYAGIAPQGRREYFFPLINFMTTSSIWLPTKLVDPKVRVYSRFNPVRSDNDPLDIATPQLRFEKMEMIYVGLLYEPAIMERISMAMKSKSAHYTRCLVHDRMQQSIQSIATDTYLTDFQLTALSGEYATMTVFINRNNATTEGKLYGCNRTWTATTGSPLEMGKVTFNDSSGYPVFYNDFPASALKVMKCSAYESPFISDVKEYYEFIFCADPTTTTQSGISTGGLAMDGNFILKLQLSPFTVGATTSVEMNVLARRYAILQCKANGSYVLTKL